MSHTATDVIKALLDPDQPFTSTAELRNHILLLEAMGFSGVVIEPFDERLLFIEGDPLQTDQVFTSRAQLVDYILKLRGTGYDQEEIYEFGLRKVTTLLFTSNAATNITSSPSG